MTPTSFLTLTEIRIRLGNWREELDRRNGATSQIYASGAPRFESLGWDLSPEDLARVTFPNSWQTGRRLQAVGSHPNMTLPLLDTLLTRLAVAVPDPYTRRSALRELLGGAIRPPPVADAAWAATHSRFDPIRVPFARWDQPSSDESSRSETPLHWWDFPTITGSFHCLSPFDLVESLCMLERRVSAKQVHPMVLWRTWHALSSYSATIRDRGPNIFARIASRGGIPLDMLRPYLSDTHRDIRVEAIRAVGAPIDVELWAQSPLELAPVSIEQDQFGVRLFFGDIEPPPPIPKSRGIAR